MGFLDAILGGKKKLKAPPAADRLFAMSTAYVTLSTQHGIENAGKAGIVFQPLATSDFQQIVRDTEEVLRATGEETGTTVETAEDDFGAVLDGLPLRRVQLLEQALCMGGAGCQRGAEVDHPGADLAGPDVPLAHDGVHLLRGEPVGKERADRLRGRLAGRHSALHRGLGRTTEDEASWVVDLIHPAIQVVKTGVAPTRGVGDTIAEVLRFAAGQ